MNTSSSSVANFEPLKASDVVTHSSKSVEESSLNDDSFTTSSLPTQITINNSIAATATALQELISRLNNDYDPVITSLLNYYSDITQQKPPVASSLVLPTDIAFPPESAATSSNNNNNFTLDDINSLLLNDKSTTDTIECQTPSSPNVTTPEDSNNMSWMENMDVLFGEDMAQAKVDPFSGDSEFDSLLGL